MELLDGEGPPIIVVAGDADVNAAPAVDSAIAGAAETSSRVIVDLNSATLIDSRTIGVLASWVSKLRSGGGDLAIVCKTPDIVRLFRTIGLEQSFEFFDSREEAAAVGGSSN